MAFHRGQAKLRGPLTNFVQFIDFRIDNFWPLRYPFGMRLSGRKYSPDTQHWTERQRFVLLSLIGFNVAFFVAQLFLDAFQPGFVRDYLGLTNRGVHDA